MGWKKHRWKILLPLLAAALLAGAFYWGDPAQEARGRRVAEPPGLSAGAAEAAQPPSGTPREETPAPAEAPAKPLAPPTKAPTSAPETAGRPTEPATLPAATPPSGASPGAGPGQYQTAPVPEGKPAPAEPQDAQIGSQAYTCTLSISCATVLDNLGLCDPEKAELVPEDGWVLPPTAVAFSPGESVFDILQRACRQLKIHLEYQSTPLYNSAYIEGIHNLYEFDAGELSGWHYKVNGWFPNYGCSRYAPAEGDVIEWLYSCDLGQDIGGSNTPGG